MGRPRRGRLTSVLLVLLSAVAGRSSLAIAAAATTAAAPADQGLPATMKAIRFHAYGDPGVLVYEDAPVPRPGEGEMLVRVRAAGVNPVDWKIRNGNWKSLNLPLPMIPGYDVSGIVESIGAKVTRFKKGDAIYAYMALRRGGAYAEYALVREDEAAAKPAKVDDVAAASVPLAALTAWQALVDTAKLGKGQRVLIHAAAGGVGTFAVQIARSLGATAIGTASASNQEFLKGLGCDQVVDYKRQRFEEVVTPVDVVLDSIGGDTLERSFKVVKPGGIIVSIVDDPSRFGAAYSQVRSAHILVSPNAAELAQIAALIDAGTIKPVVSQTLALAEARHAHELSETGHTRGKIVLRVGS